VTTENLYTLEYPLRLALRALFKRHTGVRDFSEVWTGSTPETRLLLRTVSAFAEFDLFRHEINRVVEMPEDSVRYIRTIHESKRLAEEVGELAGAGL